MRAAVSGEILAGPMRLAAIQMRKVMSQDPVDPPTGASCQRNQRERGTVVVSFNICVTVTPGADTLTALLVRLAKRPSSWVGLVWNATDTAVPPVPRGVTSRASRNATMS